MEGTYLVISRVKGICIDIVDSPPSDVDCIEAKDILDSKQIEGNIFIDGYSHIPVNKEGAEELRCSFDFNR
jgi:hypothetical protein